MALPATNRPQHTLNAFIANNKKGCVPYLDPGWLTWLSTGASLIGLILDKIRNQSKHK